MSTAHSPGTCIAFRIAQPKQFRHAAGVQGMLNRFEGQAGVTETDIGPEEYRELVILDEFLTHHVNPNRLCDVQCMLLWSEWVRIFRRHTHRFPKLILEKEFSNVIMNQFGIMIVDDNVRGAVYPGIRFVPSLQDNSKSGVAAVRES